MRPTDSHQHSSARPNLMSGNRKRPGPGATILDQLEPKAARARAAFGIGVEPRWLFAAAGAIALLVAILSAIAWNNGPRTLGATPLQAKSKPVFEAGPARVERAAPSDARAAKTLLAQTEPAPVPLVVLPKEVDTTDTVRVVAPEAPPRIVASEPARAPVKAKPFAKAPGARRPPVRQLAKRVHTKPAPTAEAVTEPDPDVALISAIRRATEPTIR